MNPRAEGIIALINQVALERRRRESVPGLHARVAAVKHFQQRRFMHTYSDLLASKRYGAAARFFLDDLYGPRDFSQRDAQFARVVPALVRLFPSEIVNTVETLARLHTLSEQLDSEMGTHLDAREVAASDYLKAWQATARPADRSLQIVLTLEVGSALDLYTRRPLLRHSLKLMRGPAKAAGLGELQRFLESGFDTFKAMRGANEFLDTVAARERALANALFNANLDGVRVEALRLLPPDTGTPTRAPQRP
ncbi:MAG TPA: hypothetical protein PKC97_17670 [Burkholderiaceae bacterium]|nr:hypothetical protein [Burkholderiaceae bacterium]